MENGNENLKFGKTIILLIFISLYIFFFCNAFNIEFAPCEPSQKELEIFCFSSPFILIILISFYIHKLLTNNGRNNLIISYLKSLFISIFILFICLSLATLFTNVVQTYLDQKYVGTKMYSNYFELKCGCDNYQLKTKLFSLIMCFGTFIGGLLQYSFVILKRNFK